MVQYIKETWDGAEGAGWTVPGWYFWDEVQANCYGPYDTEEIANQKSIEYYRQLGTEDET